ncbi:hypothetical protein D0466_19965 [Peribacillus glennii]|uniref:Uncharacterized protein n=1 Tax=Peribacillus glennii TaxID=2303991 RepID=A0A372L8U3_9BACI|nr:hypothetical protein D0466_19965 [Peribacillus glennii]
MGILVIFSVWKYPGMAIESVDTHCNFIKCMEKTFLFLKCVMPLFHLNENQAVLLEDFMLK